jgi:hypothetical protein
MGRTIVIGDIHGCRDELEDLLAYVGWTHDDRVVTVGDIVVRGPEPRGTLALLRKIDARAVRGNHEDRLLRWRRHRLQKRSSSPRFQAPPKIGPLTKRTADALKSKDWEFLEDLPLFIDLPEHVVRVVHAGLIPGLPIEEQDPRAVMNIRTLSRAAPGWPLEASEERGKRSWAHFYDGPEHVVFGHNAQPDPEIAVYATGIDTGAVYGGRLTAMVLRSGERVPPPEERSSVLVSVPARRAYVDRSR